MKQIFVLTLSLLVVAGVEFARACDSPLGKENLALAYTVDVDTVAVFFRKEVADNTLANVLVDVREGLDAPRVGTYAMLDDHDYGRSEIDVQKYSATVIHVSKADAQKVTLWVSYNPPVSESEGKSLCLGPSYEFKLSELIKGSGE